MCLINHAVKRRSLLCVTVLEMNGGQPWPYPLLAHLARFSDGRLMGILTHTPLAARAEVKPSEVIIDETADNWHFTLDNFFVSCYEAAMDYEKRMPGEATREVTDLPPDLVNIVMDYAEYAPFSRSNIYGPSD